MLTVTDRAVSAIRALTESPKIPDGAGLRIASGDADGPMQLSLAAAPADGDEVVTRGDAQVFLDSEAAERLDSMMIDATMTEAGEVQFVLADA
jgi:iron-sulfur cluster assembly protein